MSQLPLFDTPTDGATTARGRLDADSERLLREFESRRLAQGAHPRSVKREVSQLRSVVRELGPSCQPDGLRAVFADLDRIAGVLREPTTMIAGSTGRARLLAVQRFIQVMGRALGRDPAADLASLGARLPARRATGWHSTGTLVAGTTARRRRLGPTLDATDLLRIFDAAGMKGRGPVLRDRVLVALHCFSGMRPEEVVRLCWEDLSTELSVNGFYGLTARIQRRGQDVRLLLTGPASEAIATLADAIGGPIGPLSGPVLRACGASDRPLSYRAARDVLRDACQRAELPRVESTALRSACAHWLRTQGLSDHEVAAVLGLARVRSVDRLLRRHAALGAQRMVREVLSR